MGFLRNFLPQNCSESGEACVEGKAFFRKGGNTEPFQGRLEIQQVLGKLS